MASDMKIARTEVNNIETVTITISKLFEATELYWLKRYEIEDLTVSLVDLYRGQVVLTATKTVL